MLTRRLLLISALLLAPQAAPGGTPFGGDDSGFVPPSAPVKRCEEAMNAVAFRLKVCIAGCHDDAAKAGAAGQPFDDEPCEQSCRVDYDLKAGRAGGSRDSCPACLDAAGRSALGDRAAAFADGLAGPVYCAGTVPFDETGGFVPPDRDTLRCVRLVAHSVSSLLKGFRKCHFHAARLAFRGEPFDEEACEQRSTAKFARRRDKLVLKGACPACLDAAGQDAIADQVETYAEDVNGAIYCASPSGAFLD
jgi:hypothetical protein